MPKKIKIREIANVIFFDAQKVVQSRDLQTKSQKFIKYPNKIFPQLTKNLPKYVRKMYF